jgi:hypothetical protein
MKKQTNFEKIRSMDKEELAEILNDICEEMDCDTCPFRNNKVCINYPFAENFLDAEAEN